jgi:hypothetical protein
MHFNVWALFRNLINVSFKLHKPIERRQRLLSSLLFDYDFVSLISSSSFTQIDQQSDMYKRTRNDYARAAWSVNRT